MWKLSLAALFVCGAATFAGPVDGARREQKFQVPAAESATQPGESDLTVRLKGNEKARIMVMGDHAPVANLELLVYELPEGDGNPRLVARDVGTKDVVGAVIVPPRTATYRVVIRNPAVRTKQNPYNECYISIR